MFVYIAEAHAEDEWPIRSARANPAGVPVRLRAHRSVQERMDAANAMRRDTGLRWYVCILCVRVCVCASFVCFVCVCACVGALCAYVLCLCFVRVCALF